MGLTNKCSDRYTCKNYKEGYACDYEEMAYEGRCYEMKFNSIFDTINEAKMMGIMFFTLFIMFGIIATLFIKQFFQNLSFYTNSVRFIMVLVIVAVWFNVALWYNNLMGYVFWGELNERERRKARI